MVVVLSHAPAVGVQQRHIGVVQGPKGHVYLVELAGLGGEAEDVDVVLVVQVARCGLTYLYGSGVINAVGMVVVDVGGRR